MTYRDGVAPSNFLILKGDDYEEDYMETTPFADGDDFAVKSDNFLKTDSPIIYFSPPPKEVSKGNFKFCYRQLNKIKNSLYLN